MTLRDRLHRIFHSNSNLSSPPNSPLSTPSKPSENPQSSPHPTKPKFKLPLSKTSSARRKEDPPKSNSSRSKLKTKYSMSNSHHSQYLPGEPLPLKYRRPVDPAHKAHLESFTWATAWRRRSDASLYSPGGSRLSSFDGGRTSLEGVRNWRRGSIGSLPMSRDLGRRSRRGGSVVGSVEGRRSSRDGFGKENDESERERFGAGIGDGEGSAVDSGVGLSVGGDDHIVQEGSDEEGDVGNVGLSRRNTRDSTLNRRPPSTIRRSQSNKSAHHRRFSHGRENLAPPGLQSMTGGAGVV